MPGFAVTEYEGTTPGCGERCAGRKILTRTGNNALLAFLFAAGKVTAWRHNYLPTADEDVDVPGE